MKKCPYCAEEIQDEAVVCRYCGRDIRAETPVQKKEPPNWISLLFGFILLVAIYAVAFLVIQNSAPTDDLESTLGAYQFITAFVITLLAVPGLDPNKGGFLRYAGIFILSLLPIVGWIVLFWAGRMIARTIIQTKTA